MKTTRILLTGIGAIAVATLTACGESGSGAKPVSFKADVQPILNQSCLECHKPGGDGYEKSGQDMTSYDALMKGTKFGATVKPNDSFTSALVMLVEGRADPSIKMPHDKKPLGKEQIATIKKWIDEGAKNN